MENNSGWSTPTRYFVLVLLLGGLLWLLVAASELIGPLAIAALAAYILNPLVVRVSSKTRLSRNWAVLLVFLLFVAAAGAAAVLIAPQLPPLAARLGRQLEDIVLVIEELFSRPIIMFGAQVSLQSIVVNWPALTQGVTRPDLLINAFATTSQNLVWVLLVMVTTYYLLLDGQRLRDWLYRLVPDGEKADVRRLYMEIRNVWNQYLRGQLRLMVIMGFLTGVTAAVIGLPGALAFGVLGGLLDVILSVGPLIVMIIGGLVGYVAGSNHLPLSNFWFALLVVLLFGAINAAENIWLRPRIMGNSMRIHPAIVFIAIVGSLALAGILMALIIVPLIGSAAVVGRYLYCRILNLEPWPDIRPLTQQIPDGRLDERAD